MDDLALAEGLTPEDRAERARDSWDLYSHRYGGEICDLITDLMHLADMHADNGNAGLAETARAEMHYEAEIPNDP